MLRLEDIEDSALHGEQPVNLKHKTLDQILGIGTHSYS